MSITLSLFQLDLPAPEIAALERLLDAGERARAGQYHFRHDASRFIARRGQLRLLLAKYAGRTPETFAFAEGPFGKPFADSAPHFSIAFSGAVALCAISTHGEIGCDIERHDPRLADRAIADRLFTAHECEALADLPEHCQAKGFFHIWTRKEAVVKALGEGLSRALDSFEVALTPGALPAPLPGLHLHAFDTLPGHSIAVCAASDDPVAPPRWFSTPGWPGADRFRRPLSPALPARRSPRPPLAHVTTSLGGAR